MSPKKEDDEMFLSDESGEEDLLSFRNRLNRDGKSKLQDDTLPSARATTGTAPQNDDDDEDPDWVRDFSQPNDAKEDRRRALTSVYDIDDDSLVDLTSDKDEPVEVKDEIEPADEALGEKQEGDGKQSGKASAAKGQSRGPTVPKDSLPLVFAPKLDDSIVLIQGDDDGLDLSGDIGAVGRVKIDKGKLFLDIKGVLYSTHAYPTNSMCMVSIAEDEARVTAVIDEAVILKPERDILASEEVVAGTLEEDDDFSGDNSSEEDGGKSAVAEDKTDRAGKSAQTKAKRKATPGRKPKAKSTGAAGPKKSLTKTPRKKSSK